MSKKEKPNDFLYYQLNFADGSVGRQRMPNIYPQYTLTPMVEEDYVRDAKRDGRQPKNVKSVEEITHSAYYNRF